MIDPPVSVTEIEFRPTDEIDRAFGVLAFVALTIDGRWRLDGLSIRRGRERDAVLVFPHRIDGRRVERPSVRPLDEPTRRAVEDAVLDELVRQHLVSRADVQRSSAAVSLLAVGQSRETEVDQ